jgi:hypothetical protein
LNPFSISTIMFCHSATGSLLLSAIGILQRDRDIDARSVRKSGLFRATGKPPR